MEILADKVAQQKQAVKRLQELVGDLITGTDPEDRKENGKKAIDILQAMEEEADAYIEPLTEAREQIGSLHDLIHDLYKAVEEGKTESEKKEIMQEMEYNIYSIEDTLECRI